MPPKPRAQDFSILELANHQRDSHKEVLGLSPEKKIVEPHDTNILNIHCVFICMCM